MKYEKRQYPLFSACGLNCGLCPRFYTDGKSKCPGCAGAGFERVHPSCGVLSCCLRKGLEYCFLCEKFPCAKYDGADMHDSFIAHRNQIRDMERARTEGIAAYTAALDEKTCLLKELLENHDDGRRKSLFCTAVNLLDLKDVRLIINKLRDMLTTEIPLKERAASAALMLEKAAESKGIPLKLRKKQ